MAEQTQDMDTNLYNAARWETNIPNGVAANELYLYLTRGDGNNALHIAAQHDNPEFIKISLADANPMHYYRLLCHGNSRGKTPLHLAAEFGCMAAVEALLHAHDNAPAAVQQFVHQSKPCWTEGDIKGDTPFHKALRNRHEDIAMFLLEQDLTLISVDNESGESPAYLAAKGSCIRVLQNILYAENNQRRVSFSGPFGQTVFHSARRCNGGVLSRLIDMRGYLLKQRDGKGKTIVHYAVEENRLATVETLLNADSSCGYLQDNDGFTPLLVASRNGLFPMVMTILKLCPQSVEFRNNQGKTVLHVAKISDDLLGHLLENNISKKLINEVDNDGNTPLHAALINSKYQEASDLLLVNGCDWSLRNNEGYSPLDLCKSSYTISYEEPVYKKLRELEGEQRQVIIRPQEPEDEREIIDTMEEEELEILLNKIAVAAGLLLSLTFQMAFSVPGGYDSTTGLPILRHNQAFVSFTIFNAMTFIFAVIILIVYTFGMGKRMSKRRAAKVSIKLVHWGLAYFIITFFMSILAVSPRKYSSRRINEYTVIGTVGLPILISIPIYLIM